MASEEFVGYENLISYLEDNNIPLLDGDILEIGAYMGGGTAKLAAFAGKYGKRVFAVDQFEPSADPTIGKGGVKAKDVYEAFLEGRSMLEAFLENTRPFPNVVLLKQDSRAVRFPPEQRFVFGFIDGCHTAEFVESDFRLIWPHLMPGGVVGLHDYKFDDWPGITEAAQRLLAEYAPEIRKTDEIEAGFGILTLMVTKR